MLLLTKISLGHCIEDENIFGSSHSDDNISIDSDSMCEKRYIKHNVKRREKRAQSKIKRLQLSRNSLKSANKRQVKQIHQLSEAVNWYVQLIKERNSEITKLKQSIQCLEETVEFLECELIDFRKDSDQIKEKNESYILDLTQRIEELQNKYKLQTLSSKSFNCNVRELYYALLTMHVPPAKIRPIIENVISCLLPSVSLENVRLPKKSCASYMRSQEMPTLSLMHKSSQLSRSDKRHLNSDGTTLHQVKKVAFLINGIVLGISDVADGSSQTALREELQKLDGVEADDIKRIVSSTSDGAATQSMLNRLLEVNTMKEQRSIVENKCAMHLGVNLRQAQVKAMSAMSSIVKDDHVAIQKCNNSVSAEESLDDELHRKMGRQYNDIDVFVHEICKAFGHLGTPEYGHGASTFRVFLASKILHTDKEQYYVDANEVYLERQVGNRYYVTSCNAGRIFWALIEFLNEQQHIKPLNHLESTCLQKLTDPLIIAKAHLEGLIFDRV